MTAIGVAAITLAFIGLFIFCVANLIDCQERRFPTPRIQRKWTLLILLLPIIGAIVYRCFGQKQGEKQPPAFPRYY
jgi:hypothetical protein